MKNRRRPGFLLSLNFFAAGDGDAAQLGLQLLEERFYVEDEEEARQGVPLPDREVDCKWARHSVKEEGGGGVPVESRHPGPEDGVEAHGMENSVHPRHAHPIIGVEEVEAEEETRPLPILQKGRR